MIVILKSNINQASPEYLEVMEFLKAKPGIRTRVHKEVGALQTLIEIYLIGNTSALDKTEIESLPGVERVVRISEEYRIRQPQRVRRAVRSRHTGACGAHHACAQRTRASMHTHGRV